MKLHCGDVRSRTSYNANFLATSSTPYIAVTFDLGRVTTFKYLRMANLRLIAVTFDLGRVTTYHPRYQGFYPRIAVTFDLGRVTTSRVVLLSPGCNCGDVRSRTSYNPFYQGVSLAI